MEHLKLFHNEAISSCSIKKLPSLMDIKKIPSPNGKIQLDKKIKTQGKKIKSFCPWDCSSWSESIDGKCIICGGVTN